MPTEADAQWRRLATIADLVERSGQRPFGRTALMECLYFLETLRGVPLGYHFRLYSYGPYDWAVLDDLQYAEFLGAVRSRVVYFPGCYRYEVESGSAAAQIKSLAAKFLAKHEHDLQWVIDAFGARSASDLETMSMLVYADQTATERREALGMDDRVTKVHGVRPYMTRADISRGAGWLKEHHLIKAA